MALIDLSASGNWNNPGAGVTNTAGISITSPNPPFYRGTSGGTNGHLVYGFSTNSGAVPPQIVGAVPSYFEVVWRPTIPANQSNAVVGVKFRIRFTNTSSPSSFSFWRDIFTSPLVGISRSGVSQLWAVTVSAADINNAAAPPNFPTDYGIEFFDSVAGNTSSPRYSMDWFGFAAQFSGPTPTFFKTPPVLATETP
jgi:hypothetical protein